MRKNIKQMRCNHGAAILMLLTLWPVYSMAMPTDSIIAVIQVSGEGPVEDQSFHVLRSKILQTVPDTNVTTIAVPKAFGSFLPLNYPIVVVLQKIPGKTPDEYQFDDNSWIPIATGSQLNVTNKDKTLLSIDQGVLQFVQGQFKGGMPRISLLPPTMSEPVFAEGNRSLLRQACKWLLNRGNNVSARISPDTFKQFQDMIIGKGGDAPLELLPLLFEADHVRCFEFLAVLDASPELKDRARFNFPDACAELLPMASLSDIREPLLKLLASRDPRMRSFIARKLADIHTPTSIALLVPALASNDLDLQYTAIRGIRELGVAKGIIIQQPSIDTFEQNPQKYISQYADFIKQNATDLGISR
jgi:hypothetical protein